MVPATGTNAVNLSEFAFWHILGCLKLICLRRQVGCGWQARIWGCSDVDCLYPHALHEKHDNRSLTPQSPRVIRHYQVLWSSAPFSNSNCIMVWFPSPVDAVNGVRPWLSRAWISGLYLSNNRTTSGCPCRYMGWDARCNGVALLSSRTLASTPCSRRARATPTRPSSDAQCNGVRP